MSTHSQQRPSTEHPTSHHSNPNKSIDNSSPIHLVSFASTQRSARLGRSSRFHIGSDAARQEDAASGVPPHAPPYPMLTGRLRTLRIYRWLFGGYKRTHRGRVSVCDGMGKRSGPWVYLHANCEWFGSEGGVWMGL
jgi:hypothetical protein